MLTLIYLLILLVPGLLLVHAAGREADARGLLLALAAGWVLAVAAALLVRVSGLGAGGFTALLAAELLVLGTLAWRRGRPQVAWQPPALVGGVAGLAGVAVWLAVDALTRRLATLRSR